MYATLGLLQTVGVGIGAIVVVIVAIFVVSVILSAIKIVKEGYDRGIDVNLPQLGDEGKTASATLAVEEPKNWISANNLTH